MEVSSATQGLDSLRTMNCCTAAVGRAVCFVASVLVFTSTSVLAQTNSWTNPTGGKWEDANSWSLGAPPGAGQMVFVANHGWKAVSIDNNTAANFPQTMSIGTLWIISPGTDTVNTVLLNYAGLQTPLTASDLEVSNSTSMVILQSAVQTGYFSVGGTVTEDVSSQVSVSNALLVYGAYYLTNGTVNTSTANGSGESVRGQFVQAGGSNYCGSLLVMGEYDLSGGQLVLPPPNNSVEGLQDFGNFVQSGGSVNSTVIVGVSGNGGGNYQLSGGFVNADYLAIPANPDTGTDTTPDTSYMVQTGGTNVAGWVDVGQEYGFGNPSMGLGTYSLSNGLFVSGTLNIDGQGNFYQYGGVHSNASMTLSQTELATFTNYFVPAHYYLNGGTFTSGSVSDQSSVFSQAGGSSQITTLGIISGQYGLTAGQLSVANLSLSSGAIFLQSGGTVILSGTLILSDSSITVGPGSQQLGELQLSTGGSTNSTFTLSSGASALRFANSSSLAWSSGAMLIISNWNGSTSGGGSQQIFFGSDNTALTSQQLSQIRFQNPAGFVPGSYPATILASGEIVPNTGPIGTANSWINPTSGNWDNASSWSLGALPNSSQAILITNSGWKAVSINPSTPINFPNSMTVSSLTIQGATNTENTLLLNYFGTNVSLTVLNGLTLQDYAQILDFNSALVVQGGTMIVTNSQINQDGGFINTMNAQMNLSDSVYNLTNGDFEGGSVSLGYPASAHFNQYGGTAIITNLGLASSITGPIQNGISLYGGTLNLPGGMFMLGQSGGVSYFQAGGTNLTTQITIEPNYGGFVGGFTLNGGLLADSGVRLAAGYETPISITQNGGSHVVTNTLFISGSAVHADSVDPATYYLNGGTLSAGVIELDADNGDSVFVQSNGIVGAATVYAHSQGYYLSLNTHIMLAGGTLSCSNYTTDDGQATLNQTGGALVVSNLLDFVGSRNTGGPVIYYGLYTFTGGTLTANNINMTAMTIGDGTTNRISNPGTFSLSHLLQIGNAVEQLGHFILVSNATIDLAGSASRLSFANSSSQTWASGATLLITDWNGNPGGGGAEQLKFGADQSGLTSAQLSQIQFRIGTNSYSAKILSTGEVVPGNVLTSGVAYSQQGNNLVLTWPSGWTLQSSTNVFGPYSDVSSATSPFTNNMTLQPQQFFRLRQ